MINLLEETLAAITESGHSVEDIIFVGTLPRKEYDGSEGWLFRYAMPQTFDGVGKLSGPFKYRVPGEDDGDGE